MNKLNESPKASLASSSNALQTILCLSGPVSRFSHKRIYSVYYLFTVKLLFRKALHAGGWWRRRDAQRSIETPPPQILSLDLRTWRVLCSLGTILRGTSVGFLSLYLSSFPSLVQFKYPPESWVQKLIPHGFYTCFPVPTLREVRQRRTKGNRTNVYHVISVGK